MLSSLSGDGIPSGPFFLRYISVRELFVQARREVFVDHEARERPAADLREDVRDRQREVQLVERQVAQLRQL